MVPWILNEGTGVHLSGISCFSNAFSGATLRVWSWHFVSKSIPFWVNYRQHKARVKTHHNVCLYLLRCMSNGVDNRPSPYNALRLPAQWRITTTFLCTWLPHQKKVHHISYNRTWIKKYAKKNGSANSFFEQVTGFVKMCISFVSLAKMVSSTYN